MDGAAVHRWRAIPERHGKWSTVWRRLARWRDLGVFEAVFAALAESGVAGQQLQMLDSTTRSAPVSMVDRGAVNGAKGGKAVRRWAARGS
jgi:transposase